MFEAFLAKRHVSDRLPIDDSDVRESVAAGLFEQLSGCSFDGGLYRVHCPESSAAAAEFVEDAFPEFQGKLLCFGFDWLGRQFTLDPEQGSRNDPEVLMFEPGTGQVLQIPVPFSEFHDRELVDFGDAALASEFYEEWQDQTGQNLRFDQCAGYEVPLFLGGKDVVENLKIIDVAVYWTILGQLRAGIKELAPGMTIEALKVAEQK